MVTIRFKDGGEMHFPHGQDWKWQSGKIVILDADEKYVGLVNSEYWAATRLIREPVDIARINKELQELKEGLE